MNSIKKDISVLSGDIFGSIINVKAREFSLTPTFDKEPELAIAEIIPKCGFRSYGCDNFCHFCCENMKVE